VTRDVPANAVVVGNPARIRGYVHEGSTTPAADERPLESRRLAGTSSLIPVTVARDLRGSLAAVELADGLPFVPQRLFAVFDVPSKDVRGEHAHRVCSQVLVCVRGSVRCIVDDGTLREEVVLDHPDVALHMPPMVWGTQFDYSADAVLVVFASHRYDSADYIRDYDAFLAEVGSAQG
jgi:hypothetical protein